MKMDFIRRFAIQIFSALVYLKDWKINIWMWYHSCLANSTVGWPDWLNSIKWVWLAMNLTESLKASVTVLSGGFILHSISVPVNGPMEMSFSSIIILASYEFPYLKAIFYP